jgi:hypothetical protein
MIGKGPYTICQTRRIYKNCGKIYKILPLPYTILLAFVVK